MSETWANLTCAGVGGKGSWAVSTSKPEWAGTKIGCDPIGSLSKGAGGAILARVGDAPQTVSSVRLLHHQRQQHRDADRHHYRQQISRSSHWSVYFNNNNNNNNKNDNWVDGASAELESNNVFFTTSAVFHNSLRIFWKKRWNNGQKHKKFLGKKNETGTEPNTM